MIHLEHVNMLLHHIMLCLLRERSRQMFLPKETLQRCQLTQQVTVLTRRVSSLKGEGVLFEHACSEDSAIGERDLMALGSSASVLRGGA